MSNSRDILIRALQGTKGKEAYFVIGYNDGRIERVQRYVSQGGCNIFVVGYAENFNALTRSQQQAVIAKDEANHSKIMAQLESNLYRWLEEGKPIT